MQSAPPRYHMMQSAPPRGWRPLGGGDGCTGWRPPHMATRPARPALPHAPRVREDTDDGDAAHDDETHTSARARSFGASRLRVRKRANARALECGARTPRARRRRALECRAILCGRRRRGGQNII